MKNLVVRFENPAVHVQTFLAMNQQPDEGIRHFLARLRGVATHCEFRVRYSCTQEVSYADNVIRFKLVAGLIAKEIKEDVLGTVNLDLEATVKMIEGKEGAKKAKQSISQSTTGHLSQVGKVRLRNYPHCGRLGHGCDSTDREKHCPADSKTCDNCGKKGHFKFLCKGKSKKTSDEQKGDVKEVEADIQFVPGSKNMHD